SGLGTRWCRGLGWLGGFCSASGGVVSQVKVPGALLASDLFGERWVPSVVRLGDPPTGPSPPPLLPPPPCRPASAPCSTKPERPRPSLSPTGPCRCCPKRWLRPIGRGSGVGSRPFLPTAEWRPRSGSH